MPCALRLAPKALSLIWCIFIEMNYLAHACLSFGDPDILAGNMISDFVKGKKKFDYPDRVQMGITLHRKIDEYTDTHPATRQAKQFLKTPAGLYAGAFLDIIYDHFLANDPYEFEEGALAVFTQNTYSQLETFKNILPEKFQKFLFYMRTQDWLLHYQSTEGIHNSFRGLCRRAKYIDDPEPVFDAFLHHYEELKMAYEFFFPHVKTFAYHELLYLRGN
jgi:acyl carrier protein phosphodiesterase